MGAFNKPCDCYVRRLHPEMRVALHYGAHNPTCPAYRESLDPVDQQHDREFRLYNERPREWMFRS